MSKKYLLLGYTGIAVPLESLAACGNLRYIGQTWDEKQKKTIFWDKGALDMQGQIIDENEIRSTEPKEEKSQ